MSFFERFFYDRYIAIIIFVIIVFFYLTFYYYQKVKLLRVAKTLERKILSRLIRSIEKPLSKNEIISNFDDLKYLDRILHRKSIFHDSYIDVIYLSRLINEILNKQLNICMKKFNEQINILLADNFAKILKENLIEYTKILDNDISQTSEKVIDVQHIIREISHSLNTPLAQIEAIVLRLQDEYPKKIHPNLYESLIRIGSAVNLCKSTIYAFRELVKIVEPSREVWEPRSIKQNIEDALKIYTLKHKKRVEFKVQLPEKIDGYSINYITAILLPIVENAVEAVNENGRIVIDAHKQDNKLQLIIKNTLTSHMPRPKEDIFRPGFTTKEDHEGMGLSIVKDLLCSVQGTITYNIRGTTISFSISLPIK